MAVYALIGTIVREVKETILLEIEADDPDEAQDVAYDILSEYPSSEFVAKRLRIVQRASARPTGVALEFQQLPEEHDQQEEVEEVFSANDDNEPDDTA